MTDQYGNIVKLPSMSDVSTEVRPSEVFAGYSPPPDVKGCTLAGGNGVLDAGTILAKDTASGKFVAYDDASATAGVSTAIGALLETVDTGDDAAVDAAGNIVLGGVLKHDVLVAGGLDAAAITDLNGRVVGHLNQFIF